MTIPAIGCAGSTEGVAHTVNAGGILSGFFLMATPAIGRRQSRIMHQFFDANMAIGAVEFGMDREVKTVCGKNWERDVFTVNHAAGGGVSMAIQAVGVCQLVVCARKKNAGKEKK